MGIDFVEGAMHLLSAVWAGITGLFSFIVALLEPLNGLSEGAAILVAALFGFGGVIMSQSRQSKIDRNLIQEQDEKVAENLEEALKAEAQLLYRVAESRAKSVEAGSSRQHATFPPTPVFHGNAERLPLLPPDFVRNLLSLHSYLHDANQILQLEDAQRRMHALSRIMELVKRL